MKTLGEYVGLMSFDKFENGINLLKNVYGDNKYHQERIDILYLMLSKYTTASWLEVCKRAIANEQFAPMLEKLEQYAFRYGELIRKQEKPKQGQDNGCKFCKGTGAVNAVEKEENEFGYCAVFSFQCNKCEAGKDYCSGMPLWSDYKSQHFKLRFNA